MCGCLLVVPAEHLRASGRAFSPRSRVYLSVLLLFRQKHPQPSATPPPPRRAHARPPLPAGSCGSFQPVQWKHCSAAHGETSSSSSSLEQGQTLPAPAAPHAARPHVKAWRSHCLRGGHPSFGAQGTQRAGGKQGMGGCKHLPGAYGRGICPVPSPRQITAGQIEAAGGSGGSGRPVWIKKGGGKRQKQCLWRLPAAARQAPGPERGGTGTRLDTELPERRTESTRGKRGEAEELGRKAAGWGLQEEGTLGRGPWGSAVASGFSPHTSGRSSEGLGGAPGGCRVEGRQERGSKRQ